MDSQEKRFNRSVSIALRQLDHKIRFQTRKYTYQDFLNWLKNSLKQSEQYNFKLVKSSVERLMNAIVFLRLHKYRYIN